MTTFRKTLMATTVLAGLAIFAFDAAQAGPNGGPSLGSISGFSSMRMDFNRVGGPNRALSRDDMRVVPLDVVKKSDKPKDTKNAAKKGTDFARVSNPKPAGGGKGKEGLGNQSGPRIPAPIAELYRVTGGNLDDISKLAELASWLQTGLPAAGNPAFPQPGGGSFVWPEELGNGTLGRGGPQQGDKNTDRYWGINGWAGHRGAPQPFGDPSGKVSNGPISIQRYPDGSFSVSETHPNGRDWTYSEYGPTRLGDNATVVREERHTTSRDGHVTREPWRKVAYDIDDPAINGGIKDGPTNYAEPARLDPDAPRNTTGGENEDQITESEETSGGENPPDSQPVEEGTGRPGRSGWCSPTGGCVIASPIPPRRIIPPAEDSGTPPAHRQSPSWATDPSEEGYTGGGGGGYNGYRPQDEEGGGIGGPGNPELSALNAPL